MNSVWVQTGKIGDVLSLVPILYGQFRLQGVKPKLLIAEEYADTVALCDYIEPVIWNGHWQDLYSAIQFAKKHFDRVIVPQTYGKEVAIAKRRHSWQLDQYERAGALHQFDKLPLILNRPSNAQELVARHLGIRPTILFADQGESSPFPHSDRLAALLEKEFGATHQIVRLSGIRLDNFCDCIALYDAAKAIVVTETAHLHLSKATKTPVFALTTNLPTRWHGSAWSKHFRFYARYNQYEREEAGLIEAIRKAL